MSSVLLDSNVFYWSLVDKSRISPRQLESVASADLCYVSVATVWELGIKAKKGSLRVDRPFPDFVREALVALDATLLDIRGSDALRAVELVHPLGHKDPFDRLIAAQCLERNLALVTSDSTLSLYGVLVVS